MLAVNRRVIEQFRAGGPVDGMTRERLLLLTTTGRRSGQARVAPMMFHRDGAGLYVIASANGAPRDPAWYLNLLASPQVHVEIGAESYDATAEPLAPADHERVWAELVLAYPFFSEHQERAGRRIPVVSLRRS